MREQYLCYKYYHPMEEYILRNEIPVTIVLKADEISGQILVRHVSNGRLELLDDASVLVSVAHLQAEKNADAFLADRIGSMDTAISLVILKMLPESDDPKLSLSEALYRQFKRALITYFLTNTSPPTIEDIMSNMYMPMETTLSPEVIYEIFKEALEMYPSRSSFKFGAVKLRPEFGIAPIIQASDPAFLEELAHFYISMEKQPFGAGMGWSDVSFARTNGILFISLDRGPDLNKILTSQIPTRLGINFGNWVKKQQQALSKAFYSATTTEDVLFDRKQRERGAILPPGPLVPDVETYEDQEAYARAFEEYQDALGKWALENYESVTKVRVEIPPFTWIIDNQYLNCPSISLSIRRGTLQSPPGAFIPGHDQTRLDITTDAIKLGAATPTKAAKREDTIYMKVFPTFHSAFNIAFVWINIPRAAQSVRELVAIALYRTDRPGFEPEPYEPEPKPKKKKKQPEKKRPKTSECAVCSKIGENLKRCGKCQAVSYCSKECQVNDWHDRHSKVCK